jgi:uncharacterized membrane protein YhaH (DUF805 family)
LWWLTAAIGFVCIRSGRIALHKPWMMRSYGMTLVFVTSRVPDAIFDSYTDQTLSDMLWGLVVLALLAPDFALTARELWRRWRRPDSRLTPPSGLTHADARPAQ